jgi:ABC-type glycerol-3-phosphate transport system substrate-binding protein
MVIVTACGGNAGNNTAGDVKPPATESGQNAGKEQETDKPEKKDPLTLTVQYPKADNPVAIEYADDAVKRFTAKNPDVIIKKNDWQYSSNEIGIKMAARQAPSFFNTFATEGRTLIEHGWAADLTSVMESYEYADDFNETLTEPFMFEGKLYAIPRYAYIMTITLNKKLFEDKNIPVPTADWSWDEFYEAAEAVSDPAKGIAGFAIMAKGTEGGWNWSNFLYQAGGVAEKIENGKVSSAFNSEAGVKAMEFLKKIKWEANALPTNWALNYGDTWNLFKQGRAAMIVGNAVEDAVNNGGMNKEDLLVLPMPSMEKGGDHVGVLGGDYWIINPQESLEVQKLAFAFATEDYFTEEGLEATRADLESRKEKGQIKVPNVADYYKADSDYGKQVQAIYDEYQDTVYQYDPAVLELIKGAPEPSYNGQDFYAILTNVMQEVFTDKDADVKALLDAAAKKFDDEFLSKVAME